MTDRDDGEDEISSGSGKYSRWGEG